MISNHILLALVALATTACGCHAQTAPALPAATELLPPDLATFKSYGQGPQKSAVEIVPVEGQTFSEALQLTTLASPTNYWDYGSRLPL